MYANSVSEIIANRLPIAPQSIDVRRTADRLVPVAPEDTSKIKKARRA